jgi:DNA-binding response OmpR family regulator
MIILIVEDDPLIAMDLEAVLSDAGHIVRGPASTAKRALELASLEPIDLALVNIDLRHGDSGVDLARELLKKCGLPSLFVSGQEFIALNNRDAAIGFLNKPCNTDTLLKSLAVVQHLLDKASPPAPTTPNGLLMF